MKQEAGALASGLAVGLEYRLDARANVRHPGIGVAHRARGAYRGAAAATHAQVRLDLDPVFPDLAGNGPRRANVDALRAADDLGTAVRADLLAILEELRLLELARHVGELAQRTGKRQRV